MEELLHLPHRLALDQREKLTLTGVTEVVSFDDAAVILKTQLGTLTAQGKDLSLKTLSTEGGQVTVNGHIDALYYEDPRPEGFFRRWLK